MSKSKPKQKKPFIDKLTDWKNEPKFEDLFNDYTAAESDHNIYLRKLASYRENLEGGKDVDAPNGRSTVKSKLIRKQAEWKYPSIEDPFLSTSDLFQLTPKSPEDALRAEQSQLYLNHQWSVKINRNKLITDIARNIVNEGTAIVKTGWMIEENLVNELVDELVFGTPEESFMLIQSMVEAGEIDQAQAEQLMMSGKPMPISKRKVEKPVMKLAKNQPVYEVCDNESVIIDPTCGSDINDAKFVIHEYETNTAELKEMEFVDGTYIDEGTGKRVGEAKGIYKNLDYISESDKVVDRKNTDIYKTKSDFTFSDSTRKKFTAYEYWGYWDIEDNGTLEPIVATWVGKTLIRLEKNPYPHKRLPFSVAVYMPIKNEVRGEPEGALLVDNQEQIGKMTRAINDMIGAQAVGQTFVDDQFFPTRTEKDNYNEGRTVYYRHGMDPKTAIYHRKVDAIDSTTVQIIQMQNQEAESLTGTKAFSQGISSQGLGTVSVGNRSPMDATAKRELSVLRRISTNLITDMGRKTIAMNQAYIEAEEIVRVTNGEFVTVKRDDIAGEFDIVVDVSTPEKDNEMAKDLEFVMQTNAASMDQDLYKIVLAKIMKLKKMPDVADQILNFKPAPNPMAEELQRLQLEEMKFKVETAKLANERIKKEIEELDSKIHERVSRTIENSEADMMVKLAKAEETRAKAAKIQVEADVLANDLSDTVNGVKQSREDELADKARMNKLEELQLKIMTDKEAKMDMHTSKMDIERAKLDAKADDRIAKQQMESMKQQGAK